MTGTRDLAILTGGNREIETEIREIQRMEYAKKIKPSS